MEPLSNQFPEYNMPCLLPCDILGQGLYHCLIGLKSAGHAQFGYEVPALAILSLTFRILGNTTPPGLLNLEFILNFSRLTNSIPSRSPKSV